MASTRSKAVRQVIKTADRLETGPAVVANRRAAYQATPQRGCAFTMFAPDSWIMS